MSLLNPPFSFCLWPSAGAGGLRVQPVYARRSGNQGVAKAVQSTLPE